MRNKFNVFFTLIFLLSTITAASGRVFSPSLGMWWWLKDSNLSDMNRDVITFSLGGWWVNWWGLVYDSLGRVPSMRSWILLSLSSRQSKILLSRTHRGQNAFLQWITGRLKKRPTIHTETHTGSCGSSLPSAAKSVALPGWWTRATGVRTSWTDKRKEMNRVNTPT